MRGDMTTVVGFANGVKSGVDVDTTLDTLGIDADLDTSDRLHGRLPAEMVDLRSRFTQIYDKGDGTPLHDLWAADEGHPVQYRNTNTRKVLNTEIWELLKAWSLENSQENYTRQKVLWQHSVKIHNMTFAIRDGRNSYGNSNVIWGDLNSDAWKVGRIRSIFVWPGKEQEVFVVVEELCALREQEKKNDPWNRYQSAAAGRLFGDKIQVTRVLRLDEIICHAAVAPYSPPSSSHVYLHCMPLQRVRRTFQSHGVLWTLTYCSQS